MTITFGPLGFGGAGIGNLYRPVDEARALDALDTAWEGGIRYFDTAPHYGLGLSERRLGAFLRDKPRSEYVVSTKVGRLLEPNPAFNGGRDLANGFDVPDELIRHFDASADGIRRSLDESLERLGLDRIDVLYLHDPDMHDLEWGLREGLPALASLRAEGLVDAIGIGVNDSSVATRAVLEADLDLVMIAGRYTLLEQTAEADLLPACHERRVQVVAAAPFNSGLLATSDPGVNATYNYSAASAEIIERAHVLARTCEEFGVELPAAALQFPMRHPLVATVVVGTANPASIAENIARLGAIIPPVLWDTLAERGLVSKPPSSDAERQSSSARP